MALFLLSTASAGETSNDLFEGVWNNFNFSRPAEEWSVAAKSFGAERAAG